MTVNLSDLEILTPKNQLHLFSYESNFKSFVKALIPVGEKFPFVYVVFP